MSHRKPVKAEITDPEMFATEAPIKIKKENVNVKEKEKAKVNGKNKVNPLKQINEIAKRLRSKDKSLDQRSAIRNASEIYRNRNK